MTAGSPRSLSLPVLAASLALGCLTLSGCYAPDGAMMNYTGQAMTYESNEWQQKTITLVDVRTETPVFSMTVPPGKWLIIQFDKNGGHDPHFAPDLMRYDVKPMGSRTGRLSSSVSVPDAASRRIDVDVTQVRAYEPTEPARVKRSDEVDAADSQ